MEESSTQVIQETCHLSSKLVQVNLSKHSMKGLSNLKRDKKLLLSAHQTTLSVIVDAHNRTSHQIPLLFMKLNSFSFNIAFSRKIDLLNMLKKNSEKLFKNTGVIEITSQRIGFQLLKNLTIF
jgi:hypothetical protein